MCPLFKWWSEAEFPTIQRLDLNTGMVRYSDPYQCSWVRIKNEHQVFVIEHLIL